MKQATEKTTKGVFVKGYTTANGRVVPDHYRSTPSAAYAPKGSFIERRAMRKHRRY
ncbi:MAG: hypothetical protein LBM63_01935 [Rikenellaceae bacterium]|jgi:hypothetical protein|nr:hypothetical protein [Rikenellaceae bacterium]